MLAKRVFDLVCTVPGLLLLLPVFAVIALLIKLDSPGPVFFRQERVGRGGRPFRIYKFRTMVADAEKLGRQITVGCDSRITRVGAFLRHYKLDELPQLINVLKGEMSLVGPRPEVPRYVALYPPQVRELVLSVPPGITDFASLEFKEESRLLAAAAAEGVADPETVYVQQILPVKLDYYCRYVRQRSLGLDFKLVLRTLAAIWR